MKIPRLSSVIPTASSASTGSTMWFGRAVSPLAVKSVLAGALALTFALAFTITYLTRRHFAKKSDVPEMKPPRPTISESMDKTDEIQKAFESIGGSGEKPSDELLSSFDMTKGPIAITIKGLVAVLAIDKAIKLGSMLNAVYEKQNPARSSSSNKEQERLKKFTSPHQRTYILMQGSFNDMIEHTKEMRLRGDVLQVVCISQKTDSKSFISSRNSKDATRLGSGVTMFYYKTWPAYNTFGVEEKLPLNQELDQFIEFVKDQREKYQKGSIVVHCEKATNFSSVYMATTLMIDQIEAGAKTLNPLKIIAELRLKHGMVYTPEQIQACFQIAKWLLAA